ncbi:hypothetical protein Flavo103_34630 [Flavobacterium collinsii]|uniref:hypothetical protein n=1 Tax=Flavobacterium collinsii TaxID=1114861 RepID=UPI0022C19F50|nr:hypothetical protein [Flavobacterium collinsii]GIQ60327.1 hypothetical protein Flavo103_34630 [Flavobacterium collinsii]
MKNNKPEFKELPENIKFATYDPIEKDVLYGEFLIATLIYNGASFNQLLQFANKKSKINERKDLKKFIMGLVLDFINLNPEYVYLINDKDEASEFLNSIGMD